MTNNGENISITLNIKEELNATIANIKESSAVELSESEQEKLFEDFEAELNNTPFASTLSPGAYYIDDPVDDYSKTN